MLQVLGLIGAWDVEVQVVVLRLPLHWAPPKVKKSNTITRLGGEDYMNAHIANHCDMSPYQCIGNRTRRCK